MDSTKLTATNGQGQMDKNRKSIFRCPFAAVYLLLSIIVLLLVSSCQTRYEFAENPLPIPRPPVCQVPIKLALVLGGGGARGMAHVGVLQEFEDAGILIDLIVGCSAGSIVGALYADYPDAHYVKKQLEPLKKWDILDVNILKARYGFVQGRSLCHFLKRKLRHHNFEQLPIPFCVVATDIRAGDIVCIGTGPLIPAVHASCAVPFVFAPVLLYDRILVDGGIADPVPVDEARQLGAHIVVAVDICQPLEHTCPTSLFGVAHRCAEIKFEKQSNACVEGADVIIKVELREVGMFDDNSQEISYQAGRDAARMAIPAILKLLDQDI